jgi:dipeptidyl aminopeptidase/acylaminoacyl peptidase
MSITVIGEGKMIESQEKWQEHFRTVQYCRPRLAQQNPAKGLVESNQAGQWLLYNWNQTNGFLQPLGPTTEMPSYEISPDGRHVLFLQDEQGNGFGHYVCRSTTGGEMIDLTPDLPPYNAYAVTFSHTGRRAGFTWSSSNGFHACVLDLAPDGHALFRREIYQTRDLITCPWLSADGQLALLASNHFSGDMTFGLLVVAVESGEVIETLWDGNGNDLHPMLRSPFSPVAGDFRVLARANRSGLRRPVIWNPLNGERLDLRLEDCPGDISPKGWSADGRQILLQHVHRAIQQFGVYDLESGSTHWLDLPGGTYLDMQFGGDGKMIAQWEDLSHPPRIVAIDPERGEIIPLLSGPRSQSETRTWQSVTFLSSDKQEIQAWLAQPEGQGPFPTIIEMHGGPETVQSDEYHAYGLTWLDLGFAFATINYRGSTTFGKAFQNQIKSNYGHWELKDLAACRRYLVQQGVTDPERVFLIGYSYGGFLTLLALGKQPELWRGGMAGGGIADWRVLYEDATESARQMTRAYFGGSPEICPDLYRDCSPITYVAQVRAPVFIWMGAQDTHVSSRQMEQYIAQLKVLGKRVESIWYAGGHGGPLDAIEQSIDIQARQIKFIRSINKKSP